MTQFAVLHIKKGGGRAGGLGRHIDRSQVPANANPADLDKNKIYVDHREHGGLKQAIENRIKEGYTRSRALRSDAVKSLNIVLSGTHEKMKEIEEDPKELNRWVKSNAKFISKEFGGKQNIVSFALHRDERTPHIHAVVVPITNDGRLSARDFIGNGKKLQGIQNRYAEIMKDFGLERGLKGSRATHTSVKEYYAKIESAKEVKISVPERGLLENHSKYEQKVEKALEPLLWKNRGQEEELKRKTTENIALKGQVYNYQKQNEVMEDLLKRMGRGDQSVIRQLEQIEQREIRKEEFLKQYPHQTEEDFYRIEKIQKQTQQDNSKEHGLEL